MRGNCRGALPDIVYVQSMWIASYTECIWGAPRQARGNGAVQSVGCRPSQGIGMFRCLASIFRNETVSSTGGAFFFLVLLLLGGFLLARGDIPGWWIWFYWCATPTKVHSSME